MFLPCGEYLIECWGASGGDRDGLGGRGAYVSGVLPLYEDTTVYVYVGEQGSIDNVRKTFNGGGSQNLPRASIQYAGSGGGASDVRLINGSWDNESSIQSRILVATGGGGASFYSTAEAPEGYGLLMTPSQDDIPSNIITNARYRRRGFSDCIQGVSISEGGHGIAIALNNQIWVWQQYPGQVLGVGFWTDLTANQKFIVNVRSNHPETQYANYTQHHGFSKVRQTFTLSPVLAPNIPANAAISYQDLCMFDNPDEGIGVCCLTCVLPPCRPYDTLRLFISICTFKGFEPVFERSELLLPIVEGYGGPCIWWSIDCRVAVVAISSRCLMTRFLRLGGSVGNLC